MEDFASLVEQHQQLVFRTLARLTGQGEHLEDLAQEVFLRLFRALPHFAGRARLSTFLYRSS
ncbi:MAG: sigma-70 family RNA polymerase sigma factor [Acidobacteriota bacterium]